MRNLAGFFFIVDTHTRINKQMDIIHVNAYSFCVRVYMFPYAVMRMRCNVVCLLFPGRNNDDIIMKFDHIVMMAIKTLTRIRVTCFIINQNGFLFHDGSDNDVNLICLTGTTLLLVLINNDNDWLWYGL